MCKVILLLLTIVAGNSKEDENWGFGTDRSYNFSLMLKLQDPNGKPKDSFGHSVSISQSIALVGIPEEDFDDDTDDSGGVIVYSLKNNEWNIIRYLSDSVPGDYFGWSVALDVSMFGVVGAWRDSKHGTFSGTAYIYKIETDSHKFQHNATRIFASNPSAKSYFGYSVAIGPSAFPGDIDPSIIVGAYGSQGTGEAYIFSKHPGSNTWVEVKRLRPSDGFTRDRFGWSVDIFKSQVVVGSPLHNTNGAAYLYELVVDEGGSFERSANASWEFSQVLMEGNNSSTAPDNDDVLAYDLFGISVACNEETVLVGASGYIMDGNEVGAVYVYSYEESALRRMERLRLRRRRRSLKRSPSDSSTSNAQQDRIDSAGLSRNLRLDEEWDGGEDFDGFSLTQLVTPPDTNLEIRFGWSVAFDNNHHRFIVGSDAAKLKHTGLAFVYRYSQAQRRYLLEASLVPQGEVGSILFGFSCDIYGDHALVGATKGTGVMDLTGTAYHFKAQTRSEWLSEIPSSQRFISYNMAVTMGVAIPIVLALVMVVAWFSCKDPKTSGSGYAKTGLEMVDLDDRRAEPSSLRRLIMGRFRGKGSAETGIDVSRRPPSAEGIDTRDFVDEDDDLGILE